MYKKQTVNVDQMPNDARRIALLCGMAVPQAVMEANSRGLDPSFARHSIFGSEAGAPIDYRYRLERESALEGGTDVLILNLSSKSAERCAFFCRGVKRGQEAAIKMPFHVFNWEAHEQLFVDR